MAGFLWLSLEHTGPTMTVNKAMGSHWSKRSPIIQQWRDDFAWLGMATREHFSLVAVEVYVTQRGVGGIGDAAGHALLAKAAIDGLVDGNVLPDDKPEHVRWVRFHAPTRGDLVPAGMVRLRIELVEP